MKVPMRRRGKCHWKWVRSPYGTWYRKRICPPILPSPIETKPPPSASPRPPKPPRGPRPKRPKVPKARPYIPRKRVPIKGTSAPTMRVRVRGATGPVATAVLYPNAGTLDQDPNAFTTVFGNDADVLVGHDFERLEDVRGAKASWQNPCVHEHIEVLMDTSEMRDIYLGSNIVSTLSLKSLPSFVPRNAIHACCGLPSPGDVSDASLWARTRAIAAIDEKVDFLAFIGELKESLSFPVSKLGLLTDYMSQIQNIVTHKFHEIRRKRLDLSDAACWHLAWEFGLKPFLGDLEALAKSFYNALQRVKWLQERNGIPTYVKSRKQLACTAMPPAIFTDAGYIFGSTTVDLVNGYGVRCISSEATFASTQCVRFRIPSEYLEGIPGLGITYLSMLGIYNPIASAWELSKFSWLVDWFVGYKNRLSLRELSFSPLGDAEYLGSVSSLRTVHKGIIFQVLGDSGNPVEVQIGTFVMENYWRIPGDFSTEFCPQFRAPLAFSQWLIALSLGVQRFLKRK